jgi:hypothetical protein
MDQKFTVKPRRSPAVTLAKFAPNNAAFNGAP